MGRRTALLPQRTNNACEMMSVSGTFSVKRVPTSFLRLDFNFAVEQRKIRANDIQTNSATRQLSLARRSREARLEQ